MAASRLCQRTLSEFQPSSRLWVPVPSSCSPSQVTQPRAFTARLSLITQNLDAFPSRPISRAKLLLGAILEVSNRPDILFLQEVKSDVCIAILGNPQVREAFLVTDAEDQTSFEGVPFANMTLLSSKRFTFNVGSQKEEHTVERGEKFMLGRVSRVKLPSKAWEMEILANLLREPGCGGGLIAGDFNAISPEDHTLLNKNGLVDAWVALHGRKGLDGATWGAGVKRRDGLGPGRLDKVAMLGVEAKDMEILRPGQIEVPKPGGNSDYIPCSDHYGLRLGFTV